MVSPAFSTSPDPPGARFRRSLRAWTALVQADLLALTKSWVVRAWVALLLLSFFIVPLATLAAGRLTGVAASGVLATYLGLFLTVWSTVIIVLSAGSVSLEADIVADGILSRACTRTQYILAKLAARVLTVVGVYGLGAGAAGYAAWRYAANDMTVLSLLTGVAIVAMALLLLVTAGVALSTLSNHTIFSVIGLLLLWYVAGPICAFLGAEYLSPASLTRRLPEILRDARAPRLISCLATPTSVRVVFSKPVRPETAERLDNYRVESEDGERHRPATAVYEDAVSTAVLSGLALPAGQAVTVTVEGIADAAGNPISPAADRATSEPVADADRQADHPARETEVAAQGEDEEQPPAAQGAAAGRAARRAPAVVRVTATRASVSVAFSQDMEPGETEEVENYVVESPPGTTCSPRTAAYAADTRSVLLSGLSLRAGEPVRVTVKDVHGANGLALDERRNSGVYREVQNGRYFLWFGLASALFALLAVWGFGYRDL